MEAERLESGLFCLLGSPYYAYGLSRGDVVSAEGGVDETEVKFNKNVQSGGHSTYRTFIRAAEGDSDLDEFLVRLRQLGCEIEMATKKLFSIDVPPASDIHDVYSVLEQGERAGVWEFEEGNCGHPSVRRN